MSEQLVPIPSQVDRQLKTRLADLVAQLSARLGELSDDSNERERYKQLSGDDGEPAWPIRYIRLWLAGYDKGSADRAAEKTRRLI